MQILNAIGEGFREGVEQEEQLRADWNVVIEDLERKLKETERDRDRYLKALSQETVKEMIEMAKKGYDH
jgi:flagellar biosynthesis/type III secretory pathway protein FliH